MQRRCKDVQGYGSKHFLANQLIVSSLTYIVVQCTVNRDQRSSAIYNYVHCTCVAAPAKMCARKFEDDDFGAGLPPVTEFLKNLLQRYTEGGQILKVSTLSNYRSS